MYHRVAELPADPWQLAVQPNHFEQQLKVLHKKFKVIPVHELVTQLNSRTVQSSSICITFDDGYSDNFVHAKPLLEKYECPATFFIASQYIDRKQLFWWDELQHILLDSPELPENIQINIDGTPFTYNLEAETVLTKRRSMQQKAWVAPEHPPTRRCELYLRLWERLRPLPDAELQDMLTMIRTWAHYHMKPDKINWPMTRAQLQGIAKHPLFDIGLHTVTHPALSFHSEDIQSREIMDNRDSLRKICHRSLNMLTYPYGDYNETTIRVAKKENLAAAFTTTEQVITRRSDPYNLGRFQVKNWGRRDFEARLSQWAKSY